MNRRRFSGAVLAAGAALSGELPVVGQPSDFYQEPPKKLPARRFDVVIAGGGTAGVVAAIAAARQGARTMLIEAKGYPGGTVVEGGTALHSFFNLWKPFPGVAKRNVVRGIPKELVDRLTSIGGACGFPEMLRNSGYDSVGTSIDTELYKLVAFEMLDEAGVSVAVNTWLAGAVSKGARLQGAITESRSGREIVWADSFVDCTGYGDLAAYAGAKFTEPNDHPVCNSMGLGNVDIERLCEWLKSKDALGDYCEGPRDGRDAQIVRIGGRSPNLPRELNEGLRALGTDLITTTVHDNYLMFIKVNIRLPKSPTDRDTVAKAELELRRRQAKAVGLFRQYIPGCSKAFIARTSPSLNIRRGRQIVCDYDITRSDVLDARHFDDDIMAYGFHDSAPRLQIRNGGTYGVPYRALRVAGLENLFAAGMLITSDFDAHMSTRNTVCSMGQGQAAGTAAALCSARHCDSRDLQYSALRTALLKGGVYLES